jgi:ribosomal protein L16/L10AE
MMENHLAITMEFLRQIIIEHCQTRSEHRGRALGNKVSFVTARQAIPKQESGAIRIQVWVPLEQFDPAATRHMRKGGAFWIRQKTHGLMAQAPSNQPEPISQRICPDGHRQDGH